MLIKLLILAGGASRRFGSDKSQALLHGRSLISHVIEIFAGLPVAISVGTDPTRFTALGLPLLPDGEFAGQGPLAGICAGLAWARDADVLITAPCDTPFLPADLPARLLPAPKYARAGGRDHFLTASWLPASHPELCALLRAEGSRKVERFTRMQNAQPEEFADGGRMFANINHAEDLAEAARE